MVEVMPVGSLSGMLVELGLLKTTPINVAPMLGRNAVRWRYAPKTPLPFRSVGVKFCGSNTELLIGGLTTRLRWQSCCAGRLLHRANIWLRGARAQDPAAVRRLVHCGL